MDQLTRLDPFNLAALDPFHGVGSLLRGLDLPDLARRYERAMDMRMDVSEDDRSYLVQVDMPGVRKDAIDISLDGNQVTIRAQVDHEATRGHGRRLCSERYSGEAFRSFLLPGEVDAEQVRADYDGGVLTLTVPKKAGAGKRIQVQ